MGATEMSDGACEIFTVSCPRCNSFTGGYVINEASEECLADIGRAALTAARIGLLTGITRGTVRLGGCKCHEATILSDQRTSAALREALATLAAIPSDDYSTDGDAEELIRRDLAMAAIVKAMKKLNIPVSYLTQEQPK